MLPLTLGDLPTDVLTMIFGGDRSWAVLELWKCGSLLLNAKFAQGGVREIILKRVKTQNKFQWPHCLKQFQHLRLLHIASSTGAINPENAHYELQQLSGALRSLQLDFPGAQETIFWGHFKNGSSLEEPLLAPPLPSLTIESATIKPKTIEIWDLNTTHAQLEELKIGPPFQPLSTLDSSVFSCIPRSVAHLELDGGLAACSSFDGIPRSLTSLGLSHHLLNASNVLNGLPSSLTLLSCPMLSTEAMETLLHHPHILPNLVTIPGDPSILANLIETMHSNGEPLPVNVQSLKLIGGPWNIISVLPHTITELDLSTAESLPTLGFEWMESLPTRLISLKARSLDWSAIDADLWPSSLKHLTLTNDDSFNPMHFHRISRSIKTLSVSVIKREGKRERLWDESGMKSALLTLGRDALHGSEKTSWTKLKLQLLEGSARLAEPRRSAIRRYICEVENGALFGLPLSLTHLSCREHRGLALLSPPMLTKLDMVCKGGASVQPDFFELIPPSLTDIALDCLSNGDLIGITRARPSSLPAFVFLSLKLANSPIVPSIASNLPNLLVWLHLEAEGSTLKAADLNDLPPHLESLSLVCAPTSLAESWLDVLPRTLKTLTLRGPSIKGTQFAQLPPNLETLDVVIEGATLAHLLVAPRSLRTVKNIDQTRCLAVDDLSESDWTLLTTNFVPLWRIWDHDPIFVEAQLLWNRAIGITRRSKKHWLPLGPPRRR